ncbi:DUF4911 domain-containing protein [Desulfomarina sp.]
MKETENFKELFLRIGPERYHFLKFILEGYDNLAVLSCIENKKGLVVLRYGDKSEKEVFSLLSSIAGLLPTSNHLHKHKS